MHRNEEGRKETVYPMLYAWRNRRDIDGCRRLAAGMRSAAEDGHRNVQQSLLSVRCLRLVKACIGLPVPVALILIADRKAQTKAESRNYDAHRAAYDGVQE